MDRRMTSCIRTIRLLRDISRSLLSFAGVFSLDWRCGGLSVVPSGLSLLSFGTQHFVLGYFRSSLRDFLCFCLVPSTSCWAIFGRPFGTLALFDDDPCAFAGDRFALLGWVVWFLTLERASYGIQIQGRGLHWLRRPAQ